MSAAMTWAARLLSSPRRVRFSRLELHQSILLNDPLARRFPAAQWAFEGTAREFGTRVFGHA